MIKYVAYIAKDNDVEVCICGEMAGEPQYTMVLLGLGFRHFSMGPAYMYQIKKIIRKSIMQYIIGFIVLLALTVFALYKIRNRFEKREFTILLLIIALIVGIYNLYENKSESYFPKLFKEHYAKTYGIEIDKLSYTLQNNQQLSSKDKFIYDFSYIIHKKDTIFLCEANGVTITKIEDTFVFDKINESCKEK
jgi:hypothetical protein